MWRLWCNFRPNNFYDGLVFVSVDFMKKKIFFLEHIKISKSLSYSPIKTSCIKLLSQYDLYFFQFLYWIFFFKKKLNSLFEKTIWIWWNFKIKSCIGKNLWRRNVFMVESTSNPKRLFFFFILFSWKILKANLNSQQLV